MCSFSLRASGVGEASLFTTTAGTAGTVPGGTSMRFLGELPPELAPLLCLLLRSVSPRARGPSLSSLNDELRESTGDPECLGSLD